MRIKQIISQIRRDFTAIYECEWCGHEGQAEGYDDDNFHLKAIPSFVCPDCGKGVHESYRPLRTKYPAGYQV